MLRISRQSGFPSDGVSPGAKIRVRIAPVKMNAQAPNTRISRSLRGPFMLRPSLQTSLFESALFAIDETRPELRWPFRKPEAHQMRYSTRPPHATNRLE